MIDGQFLSSSDAEKKKKLLALADFYGHLTNKFNAHQQTRVGITCSANFKNVPAVSDKEIIPVKLNNLPIYRPVRQVRFFGPERTRKVFSSAG